MRALTDDNITSIIIEHAQNMKINETQKTRTYMRSNVKHQAIGHSVYILTHTNILLIHTLILSPAD